MFKKLIITLSMAAGIIAAADAAETWQDALAVMPLTTNVSELNRSNCVQLMLGSFKCNDTVKALVFMPGATDEFYMFRRARAGLTNSAATLLDAVIALTNQTYIQATFRPPLLLLRTTEDPVDPQILIRDVPTASKLEAKHFESNSVSVFYDKDWDFMLPHLGKGLKMGLSPGLYARESFHFYRHSFACCNLNSWEAMQAVALAGKTTLTIEKDLLLFEGDTRTNGPVPGLKDWHLK